jgi:hypothetical protein
MWRNQTESLNTVSWQYLSEGVTAKAELSLSQSTMLPRSLLLGHDVYIIEKVGGEVGGLLNERVLLIRASMKLGGEDPLGRPRMATGNEWM